MSIPTSPRSAVLLYCQQHIDIFDTRYDDIGLTAIQGNDFKVATQNYASAVANIEAARLAYEAAVRSGNELYTVMRRNLTQCVTSIRTFAINTNDPNVYLIAQIPPRKDPSTAPPPGRPNDMVVDLLPATGAVQLRWKCANPPGTQGTSYIVRRKQPGESAFTFIGVTGEKRFVDNTFLAGPDTVQYTVQAQRADSAGPESDIFTVRFGRNGPTVSSENVKIAA
jgi:hypothetical protein